jgi:hypothetical protein
LEIRLVFIRELPYFSTPSPCPLPRGAREIADGNSGKWFIPLKFWKSLFYLPGLFYGFQDFFPFLSQPLEPFKLPVFAESPSLSHESLKER